jgi:hypothetical protein
MCFALSEILSFFVFWVEFQRYGCCCYCSSGGGMYPSVSGGCCCSGGKCAWLLLLLLWRKCVWLLLLLWGKCLWLLLWCKCVWLLLLLWCSLYIEPVTSLDKCRVAFLIDRNGLNVSNLSHHWKLNQ